jgi:hypothetical protein
MKYPLRTVIAALTVFGAAAAHSAVNYEGAITLSPPLTIVMGEVGGFGYNREAAAEVDFWSFSGLAGTVLSIQVTRLESALDPVMDLHFGTTTADAADFRVGQSWGGMQYLLSADDDLDPPSGGPFGDPYVSSFVLPDTGNYTIVIGGGGSDGEGPFSYNLSLHLQPVPEPATALLLLAGIAAVGFGRLRGRALR